jgi:putative Ca2+/H+ antiporter (TMEM165/GDT1 family)
MALRKLVGLAALALCVQISNGFAGPTLRSSHLAPGIREPLNAMSPRRDAHQYDANDAVQFNFITDDRPFIPAPDQTTGVWNKIGKIAPSTVLAAITFFGLPAASNAMSISLGGTSAWLTSLTDSGFYQAFSLVFLSEIGDKTFFVAALLAAKLSRIISFVGSLGALAVMTVISVVIGQVFHAVPTELANGVPLDDVAAVIAFTYFGIKILSEAFDTDEEGKSAMDEEFEEAEETVKGSDTITKASAGAQVLSIFALVFAAEFGDRSFLATIALSAAQNPVSVAAGAIAAHAIATGIAVIGGAYISKYVSEKVIGIIGGTLFLIFAVTTAVGIF